MTFCCLLGDSNRCITVASCSEAMAAHLHLRNLILHQHLNINQITITTALKVWVIYPIIIVVVVIIMMGECTLSWLLPGSVFSQESFCYSCKLDCEIDDSCVAIQLPWHPIYLLLDLLTVLAGLNCFLHHSGAHQHCFQCFTGEPGLITVAMPFRIRASQAGYIATIISWNICNMVKLRVEIIKSFCCDFI